MKPVLLAAVIVAGVSAFPLGAAVVALDFENEAERKAQQYQRNQSVELGCVRSHATSGDWSYRFRTFPWNEKLPQWPSFTLKPSVSDWRGYDRLTLELTASTSLPGQQVFAYFASPTGRVQTGLYAGGLALPTNGVVRWEIPLDVWPKMMSPEAVGKMHFFMTRPDAEVEIFFDNFRLLKKGEAPDASSDRIGAKLAALRESENRRAAVAHRRALERWRKSAGESSPLLLGKASSMENLKPRGSRAPSPLGPEALKIRLARNERESVQLFVTGINRDFADVRVFPIGDFRHESKPGASFPASNIVCRAVGFVKTKFEPPYVSRTGEPALGWWPDPILEYLDHVPVKAGDFQSFWIRVSCPLSARPGVYRGLIAVAADGLRREVPMTVRVNSFAVSERDYLPSAITFSPTPSLQMASTRDEAKAWKTRADPLAPCNLWRKQEEKWGIFFADYGMVIDSLYHAWDPAKFPCWNILRRLKTEGRLGYFNLGYWYPPEDLSDEGKAKWRKSTLPRIRRRYETAKDEGIIDKAYLYGADELAASRFPAAVWAIAELKRNFPEVPVFTTAYDHDYGVGSPLSAIDWFTPLTSRYDRQKADAARREGRKVWWYVCNEPRPPYANFFIESPVIESRLLLGAEAARMQSDGLLYYQTSVWNAERPIDGASAYTDWPARSWTTINGDGCLTACGPGGMPMATLRLENYRDGLEDYAYAAMLRRAAAARPDAKWASAAKSLADVPESVMKSMTEYTLDPKTVYAWRNRMADFLERICNKKR